MKTYKIVDPISLSFMQAQKQYDEIFLPGNERKLKCDDTTIWFFNAQYWVETVTGVHAIQMWLSTGRIVEIKETEGAVMASTDNKPYIKFTYFKDTDSPRTVTAARMLDGDKMYIDWCVNHMNRAAIAFQWNNYVPFWEGDTFNKAKARNIARSRVLQRRYCVELNGEERKLEQMIGWLLENTASHVQHIIRNAIAERKRALRGGLTFNAEMTATGRFSSK